MKFLLATLQFIGEVYSGFNIFTREPVAVKVEAAVKERDSELAAEYEVYQQLKGCCSVPKAYFFGVESIYNALVVDLLGPSLEDLLNQHGRSFTLKTVVLLAEPLVSRLAFDLSTSVLIFIMCNIQINCIEAIHRKGIVHRDIKPDHFLLGLGSRQTDLHIVDFGLAKPFRHSQTLQHFPYNSRVPFVGTTRYCSLNSHAGAEHTRRDDLESIAYVLIYLRRGSLPWQGLQSRSKSLQRKRQIPIDKLCIGLPSAFESYLRYLRDLGFNEEPDYDYLRNTFLDISEKSGYCANPTFDWDAAPAHVGKSGPEFPPCTPVQTKRVRAQAAEPSPFDRRM